MSPQRKGIHVCDGMGDDRRISDDQEKPEGRNDIWTWLWSMSRISEFGAGNTSRQHKVQEEMQKYIHLHVLSAESGWNISSLERGPGDKGHMQALSFLRWFLCSRKGRWARMQKAICLAAVLAQPCFWHRFLLYAPLTICETTDRDDDLAPGDESCGGLCSTWKVLKNYQWRV